MIKINIAADLPADLCTDLDRASTKDARVDDELSR